MSACDRCFVLTMALLIVIAVCDTVMAWKSSRDTLEDESDSE